MEASDLTRTVKVGDRDYTVARFRGLKAQRVLRLSAAVARKYPEITSKIAEFERRYVDEKALSLTRVEAEMRYGPKAAEVSEEAWEASGGELKLKQMPDDWDRLGAVWPHLVEAAEKELFELLAVLSLTNEELNTADNEDRIDEVIAERRKQLLHDGELEELLDLAKAAYEVSRGQFAPLAAVLAPMAEALGLTMMGGREPTGSDTSEETEKTSSPASSG